MIVGLGIYIGLPPTFVPLPPKGIYPFFSWLWLCRCFLTRLDLVRDLQYEFGLGLSLGKSFPNNWYLGPSFNDFSFCDLLSNFILLFVSTRTKGEFFRGFGFEYLEIFIGILLHL